MNKASGDVIILHMCTKNHNHTMHASWDMEYDRHNFLSFWAIFCPFTPLLTPKINIWNKCKKNPWRYPITHVYHKWRLYNVWFLRYKAQKTEFFVILDYFLLFYPPTYPEKNVFEKMRKMPIDTIILQMCIIKWKSYDVSFLRYGVWQTQFFLILDHFLPFYSPNNSENQNFEKTKKTSEDIRYHHCTQVYH